MFLAFISILIVSLISLVGIFVYFLNHSNLKNTIHLLVALSIGTLLGDAFIHIIPELNQTSIWPSINLVLGILLFFIIEKIIHWHHCSNKVKLKHKGKKLNKKLIVLNLIGDSLHNLLDGITITSTFLVSSKLGVITTIAIILHEIPQEIGDFGLLLHSGLKYKSALLLNLASALISLLGIPITLLLANNITILNNFLLPMSASSFIYIAMSDLIPELHEHQKNTKESFSIKKQIIEITLILLGIVFMALLKIYAE